MARTRFRFITMSLTTCAAFAVIATACAAPVAYVTSEKTGVAVIDLDRLTLTKTLPVGGQGPRGLGITSDGAYVLTANKDSGDLSVVDTKNGNVIQRVPIGKNPEFVRVLGKYAYVTYEPGQPGGPPAQPAASAQQGKDDDANSPLAEVAIIDLANYKIVRSVRSGHETEGVEFSTDAKTMLVTNEGDDSVSVYDAASGNESQIVKTPPGGRPRGIKAAPDGKTYVVTLESLNKFIVLDAKDFHVVKTVDTKLGPYGVAFDPSGQRLFVAAARDKVIQVFDSRSYAHLADVPVGQRCWHFSFTPDGKKLLAACGRSNAVYVLDALNYQTLKQLTGIPLAWGIVTYPKSTGTIDAP